MTKTKGITLIILGALSFLVMLFGISNTCIVDAFSIQIYAGLRMCLYLGNPFNNYWNCANLFWNSFFKIKLNQTAYGSRRISFTLYNILYISIINLGLWMWEKLFYVTNRNQWRKWLIKNHNKEKEVWLIYYRKASGKPRIPYNDAVEEALCYGWIWQHCKKYG